MDSSLKVTVWNQFGASIDMLENAIKQCPKEKWDDKNKFWYMSYHCLFWLDYYLTTNPKEFSPPAPYTMSEFDPSGAIPDRVYTKEELLDYLQLGRDKCFQVISNLNQETAKVRWIDEYKDYSMLEILLYNMRHVQHHAAQLNLILRQEIDDAPKWVAKAQIHI